MFYTILIALIVLIIGVTVINLAKLQNPNPKMREKKYKYIVKKQILSEPEQVLYHRLKEAFSEEKYTVSYQVALNRIVDAKGTGKEKYASFKRIGSKSVDYLVTDKALSPLFIIELDDSSHKQIKNKKNDLVKNDILNSVDLKIIRFDVKAMPSVEQLKEIIPIETLDELPPTTQS